MGHDGRAVAGVTWPRRRPWEGRITCDGVEEHEVLKVGDLPPLPALGHVGRFEQLPRGSHGDAPE